jgi:cyanate permease
MFTCILFPGRTASCPDVFIHTASSSESEEDVDTWDRLNLFSKEVRHMMRKMLDTNLLKNKVYLLYCIHSMILYMWYDIPYMYTPDMAIDMGIAKEHASFLISIIGIVSTVGQIMIGYIGDLPQVNALYFYNILTSCAGISTFFVPFLPSYSMLCGFAGTLNFILYKPLQKV